jgi:hypothetical protein
MRIDFEREGGYAPLRLEYHANTDELPQDIAEKLLDLVKSSGIMEIQQSEQALSKPFPDMFTYRLNLSEGESLRSFSFNDITIPASLHPLLELLQELALKQRLEQL